MHNILEPFLDLSHSFIHHVDTLSINDLHRITEATSEARAKWYDCGLALGLTAGTLDAVKETSKGDCDHCYRDTLKEWLKGAGSLPTWGALCNALKTASVGHSTLAEKLSEQHVALSVV